jgi:hypothetical protein
MNRLSTPTRLVVAALVAGSAAVLGLPTAGASVSEGRHVGLPRQRHGAARIQLRQRRSGAGLRLGACDKFAAGRTYAQVIGDIKADFNTANEYHASYLIAQTAQELCPAQIWQVRNSAAGYVAPPG